MRIFKALVKIALVFAFLACCNAALTFVLEPYGSRSQLAWTDYAAQESLDTILVGTSHVEYSIDPAVLDEECGYEAYNLGTPSQTIEESYLGIRTAYEDHQVKRAILGLSTNAVTSSSPPNPGSAFMRNRNLHVSPVEALASINEFMWRYGSATTAYSLDFPFPWASNPLRSLSADDIAYNVKAKLEGADLAEAASRAEVGWEYVGLGHGARGDSMNLNGTRVRAMDEAADEDEEAGAAAREDSSALDPDRAETLREICDYCDERGIELIVIVPPLPTYDVFDEKSTYLDTMAEAGAFFGERGVTVYDFNLASTELFDLKPEYFSDNFHLNLEGAQVFSRSLARFLNARDAGEDVGGLFETPEQKALGIDYLAALFASDDVQADGIHLDWRVVTSPEADIEYRVLVHDEAADDNRQVSGWSRETSLVYLPDEQGPVELRICARHVGSDEKFERRRTVRTLW